MSKQDTTIIAGLRDIFGFREKYDVVLACAFEPEEKGHTKFKLYDRIGEIIEKIGKKPYLPHQELSLEWSQEKIYSIPNSIVIPTSDILLAYIGLNSSAAGVMIGSAINNKIPIVYLYEEKENFRFFQIRNDTIIPERDMVDIGFKDTKDYDKGLEFASINISDGNLEKLEKCLRRFYS